MQHFIETQQFTKESLTELFKLSSSLEGARERSLEGKILATLFYEPSTRTRLSFESAMMRLGGNVISVESARETSSDVKGETLEDTIRIIGQYADAIVLRHPEIGSAARAATVSKVPIINGGDGAGQHPTQALYDLYTIEREVGRIDGIHVAIVGDLKHGRAARSICYLLGKYDVRMTFVSPPELRMRDDIKEYLAEHEVPYSEVERLDGVMREADVVYQTRIQKERFASPEEYERLKDVYVIDRALADSMKEGAIIIHPLPRVGEIAEDVDDSPHAVYFKQVGYGVTVRMAILKTILGGESDILRPPAI
ncbi:aspartate carbamoyltransferase [Candidatus Kaiserbacteria bacterium CG10_big_fil_rev_8_21_14_0_10_59_10]|uniref:Aspartate carbamoyltransferase n=1 Tax=Candidatus Kaiserbacteria bacterium CG10_big_fil_rev_8_21_14_0_10_59_10 TaxID=1974612 RepID=A0A2H0U8P1_9BACT|nr:MAG: aspartate carbamoyltransferase [Candidatus Kaiserbacteria bacterium CG10_big_fil_rev_8_21_14_0_10_59_10]